jgi:hypothetical protein
MSKVDLIGIGDGFLKDIRFFVFGHAVSLLKDVTEYKTDYSLMLLSPPMLSNEEKIEEIDFGKFYSKAMSGGLKLCFAETVFFVAQNINRITVNEKSFYIATPPLYVGGTLGAKKEPVILVIDISGQDVNIRAIPVPEIVKKNQFFIFRGPVNRIVRRMNS